MAFNINDYETVEVRLAKFISEHADFRIYTELLESSPTRFIVRASIYRTELDANPWATGLAYEMEAILLILVLVVVGIMVRVNGVEIR